MRLLIIAITLLSSLTILCRSAEAAPIAGEFKATLALPNQSSQALKQVLPKALRQVLIKVSGNSDVSTLPMVKAELSQAQALIQSYSYSTRSQTDGQQQLMVQITFDRQGILRLLKNAGSAIWSGNRPLSLILISLQEQSKNEVLSSGSPNDLTKALNRAAFRRGLPILLPMMDLQDQQWLTGDVFTHFAMNAIQAEAQRYAASSVVAGQIKKSAKGQWQGQWLLLINGEPFRWNSDGENPQAVVQAMVNKVADIMAARYAVLDNKRLQSTVLLAITGVMDLTDYAKVSHYLRKLPPVAQVAISDMKPNILLLKVTTAGGAQALTNALGDSRRLVVAPVPMSSQTHQANLYYRWQSQRSSSSGT